MIKMVSSFNEQVRRISICGEIDDEIAAHFLEQITSFEMLDRDLPITVYLNTYGGDIYSALLIYDAIKLSSCPIHLIGIGKVMSAGVLLLASGDFGHRYITPNCRVMLHQISGGYCGSMSEMENELSEIRRLQDIYVSILSKETKVAKVKIKKDLDSGVDIYMSANDAKKYGIVDHICSTKGKI